MRNRRRIRLILLNKLSNLFRFLSIIFKNLHKFVEIEKNKLNSKICIENEECLTNSVVPFYNSNSNGKKISRICNKKKKK